MATITGLQGGFVFHGSDELQRQLRLLTPSLHRKHLRQGMAKSGRILIKEMKRRAPRGDSAKQHSRKTATQLYANAAARKGGVNKKGNPKKLWKSIKQRPSSNWRSGRRMAAKGIIGTAVGPTWPEGAHAHLLEFGHKLVAWGNVTNKRVAPRPFMRPAVDASRSSVLTVQQETLRKGLEKEAAIMRRKMAAVKT